MFQAVAADDDALVWTFGKPFADFRFAFAQVEQVDVLAMGHDGADPLLIEAQDIGYDGLLAGVEDAGVGALAHQDLDLVVG